MRARRPTGRDGGAAAPSRTAAAARDMGSARVLVASSSTEPRRLMASMLEQHGYDTVLAEERAEIMSVMAGHAVDVVVVDVALDGGGADTVAEVREERRYADVPVILVGSDAGSGHGPPGVDDVVPAPLDPHLLVERVRAALRTRRSLLGMEQAHQVVASLANELLAPETDVRLHTERLGTYASQLGRRVGLSASDLHAVAYGTLLHDLAKLGIAEWILTKPGPFTEEERLAMQRHTEIGERLAAPLAAGDRLGPILRHHHERWDGGGYPDGLRGEAIPMGARIIGLVDAFDAMTQFRTYRKPLSVPDAVRELRSESGAQFDPGLVEPFVEVLEWDGLI